MIQEPRTSPEVGGMGHSIKRKEDGRFIRGKGNYVDDVVLPDMLFMDIVRSPFPHARILKIDSSRALATPGVLAVITGRDLEKYNLHMMPTLMSDTQMVLPTDRVVYQAQEVAAVDVEYDPLEPVIDPYKPIQPGATLVRPDRKDTNHIWHWEAGNKEATE